MTPLFSAIPLFKLRPEELISALHVPWTRLWKRCGAAPDVARPARRYPRDQARYMLSPDLVHSILPLL